MNKKSTSIKAKIIAFMVPSILLAATMLITAEMFMKAGMEDEILKGLLSSAYTYKDIASHVQDRERGDNTTETELKQATGYDFTWFEGDTRKNSFKLTRRCRFITLHRLLYFSILLFQYLHISVLHYFVIYIFQHYIISLSTYFGILLF